MVRNGREMRLTGEYQKMLESTTKDRNGEKSDPGCPIHGDEAIESEWG
jgi:hypothetical protein